VMPACTPVSARAIRQRHEAARKSIAISKRRRTFPSGFNERRYTPRYAEKEALWHGVAMLCTHSCTPGGSRTMAQNHLMREYPPLWPAPRSVPAIFQITQQKRVWLLNATFAISEESSLVLGYHLPGTELEASWRLGHEFQRRSKRCESRIGVHPWAKPCPIFIPIFSPYIRGESHDIYAEAREHGPLLNQGKV
jgi:hypothetical protein